MDKIDIIRKINYWIGEYYPGGTIMELIDKIKAIVPEGTNLSEIETELMGMNPLNGVKSKEDAWNLIKTNDFLISAFDSEQGKRADKVLENYKNGRMLEEWKAKEESLRAELNPTETPEQKQIRELIEKDKQRDAELLKRDLEDTLAIKAKDLGFDPIKAKDYSIYGERAIERLESDASWFNETLESRLSDKIKGQYTQNKQPVSSKVEPADLDTKIREARSKGDTIVALRLQQMKDQTV